ncbi:hypothetical protein [Nonomuraea endophytica]|uniref:hypothetical protein n=1 Tax=Nonomuraea endophytica TaxID=714136 RepID=UPI0037C637C9
MSDDTTPPLLDPVREAMIRASGRATAEAQLRLMARFGTDLERQWAADPANSPRADADDLMHSVLAAGRQRDQNPPNPTGQDLADALRMVPMARRDLDLLEHSLLRAAREAGLRWRDIAGALGLDSPQAAQQRLARLDGRAPSDEHGA